MENEEESGRHIDELLPSSGLVYSEKAGSAEVLCKPKIMPIKSVTLEKIEQMEKDAKLAGRNNREGNEQQQQQKQR